VFLAHNEISRILIRRKIAFSERRKVAIRNLIAKIQKEYFGQGKVGSKNYHIRMKKYGELIRDINRQIPLLREQLIIKSDEKHQKVRRIALYTVISAVGLALISLLVYGFWKKAWGSWLWGKIIWLFKWLGAIKINWWWVLIGVLVVVVGLLVFLLVKKRELLIRKIKGKKKS